MLALVNVMSGVSVLLESVTVSSVLTDIGTVLTAMFGWISNVFTAIAENPILFIVVVGTFGLVCIGIVRRLLKL